MAENSVLKLIERSGRPFRPRGNFRGIDSRAEGPWLGELLAPWAEKENLRVTIRPRTIRPTIYKSPSVRSAPEVLGIYDLRSLRDHDYRPNLSISPTNIVTRLKCHCHAPIP